jgi:predicted DNA-binding transcriptional regulator AlpA
MDANKAPPPLLSGRYFMRPKEYYQRVGRGAQTCRDAEKAGTMPRRIYLSPQTVVWDSEEVFAFLERTVQTAPRTPLELDEAMRKAANDGG